MRIRAAGVMALAVVGLVAGLSFGVPARHDSRVELTAGDGFTVTSTVSSSATGAVPALLYPGVRRFLILTVHNRLDVPITVNSLSAAVNPNSPVPPDCPTSNLDLTQAAFAGSLTVPAGSSAPVAVPIRLVDNGSNQNGCRNVTFGLAYSGTAMYTKVFATTTTLVASANPTRIGERVTYTATIAATGNPPSGPTGTVTFKDGTSAICANVAVQSATATCTTAPYIADGKHQITAVFANSDGNFTGSTSVPLTEIVTTTPPAACTGTYQKTIVGTPRNAVLTGTNNADLVFAWGGNYSASGLNGNDCIYAGDGNNTLVDGNGNDVIIAGDGTNTIVAGNGRNSIIVGNGSRNTITVGNNPDSIVIGAGAYNTIALGAGTDVVMVRGPGSHDTIVGGSGAETIYLGTGEYNTYRGGNSGHNVCHLPAPPSTWHGTVAGYYHDTLTNCTVVSP